MRRVLGLLVFLIGSLSLAVFSRLRPHRWLSPRISLPLLRAYGEFGSASIEAGMRRQVPDGGRTVRHDLNYAPGRDGQFDLVLPDGVTDPPLIVWMHGGGWYYGKKSDPLPYLELLGRHGFAVASLNYPRVPEHRFPAGPRAVHAAIAHLRAQAAEYGYDADRIVLAGDSAGGQLAASAALAWTSPAYARAIGVTDVPPREVLRGTALFCGTFDAAALLKAGRLFTAILASSMWAQAGTKEWLGTETERLITIRTNLPADFPPTFLRAGNADPLTANGTVPMAETMARLGLDVDSAVLGNDEVPAPHQVQFNLETPYGQEILEDLVGFLRRVTG